jgi:hypothetical protein
MHVHTQEDLVLAAFTMPIGIAALSLSLRTTACRTLLAIHVGCLFAHPHHLGHHGVDFASHRKYIRPWLGLASGLLRPLTPCAEPDQVKSYRHPCHEIRSNLIVYCAPTGGCRGMPDLAAPPHKAGPVGGQGVGGGRLREAKYN